MANNKIEIFDLTKIFSLKNHKEITALNKINIKIKEGEIFGLLGPNGAGKTTLVQILTTLLQPTSGYATIDGINVLRKPLEIKRRIGLMLGAGMIYNNLTGYDNLKFFCKIYDIPEYHNRIINIAKEFNLNDWLDEYVEKYSLGMKLKLALCRALLIDPPILFLDEPTLGLDVKTTLFFIEKINKLNKTILLTSHNMHVVEKLCHRIAFLNKGNILKIGTQEEIKKLVHSEIKIEIGIIENKDKLKHDLKKENFITGIIESNEGLVISMENKNNYHNLFSILSNFESIQKVREQESSLEDLFLRTEL
ncbi:MAG: ABC transporter ATP-binding protein [Candidatus Hodarchaeota archaeon]